MSRYSRAREWRMFGLGVFGIVALLVAIAVPAALTSDWWNTDRRVAGDAPAVMPPGPVADSVRPAWSSPATEVGRDLVAGGLVVVATDHGLTGTDPRTGDERWTYRRGNATVCDWTAAEDMVVVAFRHDGGCDDLTALSAGTGERVWYRNAELGAGITLFSGGGAVLAADGAALTAFNLDDGKDRWSYTKDGCRFGRPTLGRLGVAFVAACGQMGTLLTLHSGPAKDVLWAVPVNGEDPRVVAADTHVAMIARYGGDRAMTLYDGRGGMTGTVTGPEFEVPDGVTPSALTIGTTLVAWTGQRVVAVDLRAGTTDWVDRAAGPPVADNGEVIYPDGTGFVVRAAATGREDRRIGVDGGSVGATTATLRVGSAVVTLASGTVTAYW